MKNRIFNDYTFAFVLIVICILSVNGWSLWLDESSTAMLASLPTFNDLTTTMSGWRGSESQMPFYIGYIWVWEKIFGHSEYALRMSNVTVIFIFIAYSICSLKRMNNREAMIVRLSMALSVVTPFFIYNMNEARVNISLFAFSAVCYLALYMYGRYKNVKDLYVCLISLTFGLGFNLLFVFIIPTLLVMGLYFDKKIIWKNKTAFGIAIICSGLIGCYYLWTLSQSKGGETEKPGITNLIYALYEFLGLNGMGAPKNAIRESDNLVATVKPYMPWLLVACLGYAIVLWQMLVEKISNKLLSLFIFSLMTFFVGAYGASFRFWGRHLFMFFPLFTTSFAWIMYELWTKGKIANKIAVSFCMAMILVSSVRISFLPQYKKENIKETIAFVNEMNRTDKKNVYFAGFPELARYYQLENEKNINDIDKASKGIFVYIKSMKVKYGGKNPYFKPKIFDYKLVRNDITSEIYEFEKK